MQVSTSSDRLATDDGIDDVAALFKLLGEPTRARLLFALLDAGELRVGELAQVAGVSETVVSQAMRLLRTASVVRARREGRSMYYRLDDDHVRELLLICREHLAHGPGEVS